MIHSPIYKLGVLAITTLYKEKIWDYLKKIFKPVSKVLDKIVPNEIKPFLPYAAAFAPFIAPGIMGTSVMQRALMGGGLNIFGQLAQEGNEGDINLLSAGLGALSGAMSAPGTQACVQLEMVHSL